MRIVNQNQVVILQFSDNQDNREVTIDEVMSEHLETIKERITSECFVGTLEKVFSKDPYLKRDLLINQIIRIFGGHLPSQLNFLR